MEGLEEGHDLVRTRGGAAAALSSESIDLKSLLLRKGFSAANLVAGGSDVK
jgi:hypothetical protein